MKIPTGCRARAAFVDELINELSAQFEIGNRTTVYMVFEELQGPMAAAVAAAMAQRLDPTGRERLATYLREMA